MSSRTVFVLAIVGSGLLVTAPGLAAQTNPAHTHIGHVVTGFGGAPDGEGLLPTAQAELEIIDNHLRLAAQDMSNLQWMQTHAAHVLHALDPSRADGGPGLGFGVVAAADGIAQHIELAAGSEGASQTVTTHAPHVAAAARAVSARASEMADIAEQVASASDYTSAETLVNRLRTSAGQLAEGSDENGDGQIGWGDGEGGLAHVEQHMGFIVSGEGLE